MRYTIGMTLRTCLLCFVAMAAPSAAAAQTLHVDMTGASRAPRELVVRDRAPVVLEIRKHAFHACEAQTKSEPLAAPPSPVAQLLGALGGFVTATRGTGVPAPTTDPLGAQVELLTAEIDAASKTIEDQLADVRDLAAALPAVVACGGTPDPCSDAAAASKALDALANRIMSTPATNVASTAQLQSRIAELSKAAVARSVKNDDVEALPRIFARLRFAQELLDATMAQRQALIDARKTLLAVRDRILDFTPSMRQAIPLTPAVNTRVVSTITCENVVTRQPATYRRTGDAVVEERLAPMTATVVYRAKPWATVTAGVLASTVDKREIGSETFRVEGATGNAAAERRVGVTDEGPSQLVPFTFFNLAAPGLSGPRGYVAATAGFGLNPHNGPVQPEYFAGGTLGIGRFVALTVGVHFGTRMEPDNGFAVGDPLPSGISTVPTRRVRTQGLAVGLSYGVPLPR